jgi:serine phosphatase RsbU (regulator of sigma subunit)
MSELSALLKDPEVILKEFESSLNRHAGAEQKVRAIIEFVVIYGDSLGDRIVPLLEKGIELATASGFETGRIICIYNLWFFSDRTGQTGAVESNGMQEIPAMVEQLKADPELYGLGLNLLAYFHWFRGDYEAGFNTIFDALRLDENTTYKGWGWLYYALGVFYFDTKDLENSRLNYQKAYDAFSADGMIYPLARSASGLATVAVLERKHEEAEKHLHFAANIFRQLGHYSGLSRVLNDFGMLERSRGNTATALDHLRKSIELRKLIDHHQGLVTSYTELAEVLLETDPASPELLPTMNEALAIAIEVNSMQKQMRLYKLLYQYYKQVNDHFSALLHFEKYYELRSKLLSDESANNIKRLQTRFERETAEKQTEIERLRNVELRKAKFIIEQKNKDITDSINYAKRIQSGLLPSATALRQCLREHFTLFMPKDIVSGDFYWASEYRGRAVFTVADCTGHGIPGAFMSVLGATLLNECIMLKNIEQPSQILGYLNDKLPMNLRSADGGHLRDGMDMAVCMLDFNTRKLHFAGANNPCYIVRNGAIIELTANKQPISAGTDFEKKPFTDHDVDLLAGDVIYLSSDGFADQFGGDRDKKFGYKRFRDLLCRLSIEDTEKQQQLLASTFAEWKGKSEQVDDVCIIGVRIE